MGTNLQQKYKFPVPAGILFLGMEIQRILQAPDTQSSLYFLDDLLDLFPLTSGRCYPGRTGPAELVGIKNNGTKGFLVPVLSLPTIQRNLGNTYLSGKGFSTCFKEDIQCQAPAFLLGKRQGWDAIESV